MPPRSNPTLSNSSHAVLLSAVLALGCASPQGEQYCNLDPATAAPTVADYCEEHPQGNLTCYSEASCDQRDVGYGRVIAMQELHCHEWTRPKLEEYLNETFFSAPDGCTIDYDWCTRQDGTPICDEDTGI